jgi:hypothetical protein
MSENRIQFREVSSGVEIRDLIYNSKSGIGLPDSAEIVPSGGGHEFQYRVDSAITIHTESLRFGPKASLYVRRGRDTVGSFQYGNDGFVPEGDYEVEVAAHSVKIYFKVSSSFEVDSTDDQMEVRLPSKQDVLVGGRSFHESPAGTVTTTENIDDIIESLSYLSASLSEGALGPERSFPTLRERPPQIKLGEEFSVEDGIERPETDLEIEVPRRCGAAYSIAPLASYTGAELTPVDSSVPVFHTPETSVSLGGRAGADKAIEKDRISDAVSTLLRHLFLFDCTVRHVEFYNDVPMPRQGQELQEVLEREGFSVDIEELWEIDSLAAQIDRYLQYPIGIANGLFHWPDSADVAAFPSSVSAIPRLIDEFAEIHSPPRSPTTFDEQMMDTIEGFFEHDGEVEDGYSRGGATAVSGASSTMAAGTEAAGGKSSSLGSGRVVSPAVGDHQQHSVIGDRYPIWSSKPIDRGSEGYNRASLEVSEGSIVSNVVCNEPAMASEIEDIYSVFDDQADEYEVHQCLSKDELRSMIQDGCDFLHFVGHVDDEGLQCADGKLDVRGLEESNVESFLLNACSSYEQGEELVRLGSRAGVVTTDSVVNFEAVRFGGVFAKLLSSGFSLGAALSLVRDELDAPPRYMILGDRTVSVGGPDGCPRGVFVGGPGDEEGEVSLRVASYGGREWGVGCISKSPVLQSIDSVEHSYWIGPGSHGEWSVDVEELIDALEGAQAPVVVDNELYTAGDFSAEVLRSAAPSGEVASWREWSRSEEDV